MQYCFALFFRDKNLQARACGLGIALSSITFHLGKRSRLGSNIATPETDVTCGIPTTIAKFKTYLNDTSDSMSISHGGGDRTAMGSGVA